MSDELDRLRAARAAYAGLQDPVAAGEPWALAAKFGTEPEAAWSPRELLAHVAEMLPYWLGELERVVDGAPDGPAVPFGRVADDPVRIGFIERDRTLPLRVLFGRVDGGLGAWEERLGSLTPAEGDLIGVHPRLGQMPASLIQDRFVIGHAEDHIAQLAGILAEAARAG